MKFTKREIPAAAGNGGLFLKFKDGESKVIIPRGEIYEFFQIWENGKSRLVGGSEPGAKSRFRMNALTKEDGELKARIFEFGLTIYNQLAEIADDYPIDKTAIKVTRRGTGTDTMYMLIPAKEQPTPAQLKSMAEIPLNILEHKEAAPQPKVKNFAPGAEDEDSDEVPF